MSKFPIWLNHPGFTPAILSGPNDPPGRPAKFPPVIVNNKERFDEYEAKGYSSAAALIPNPMSQAIDPDHEYPKWVRNILCKSRDEEEEALAVPESEVAAKVKQVQTLPPPSMLPGLEDQLRDALVARAKASGLKINVAGSVEEIRAEVQRAVMGT